MQLSREPLPVLPFTKVRVSFVVMFSGDCRSYFPFFLQQLIFAVFFLSFFFTGLLSLSFSVHVFCEKDATELHSDHC